MVLLKYIFCYSAQLYPRKKLFKVASRFSLVGKVFTVSFTTLKHVNYAISDNIESVKYINGIIKSPEDKRSYRGLELKNKLKVLLISDPNTIESAAALNVSVGYLCDPDDIPGLAHFCEHMLFLGTEKYPDENDYAKYVLQSGGNFNASTGPDFTQFYFTVLPEYLGNTLDRFAQFFLNPLFTESATEREISAVHSEHEKNIPIDERRIHQVEKYISKKNHPFQKFGTGNYSTLFTIPKEKGLDIREELLKFHQKWYSANLMTLVVLGRESLDDLEKIVTSLFSNVHNKNLDKPEWKDHPFGVEQLQKKGYIAPIKDIRKISVTFPVPDFEKYYKSPPFAYISFLIGHEGPGSLLSALKAKGWCDSLKAGYHTGANGFAFFNVKADLTVDGFEHIDDIVNLIFQYINMLKKEGPQKWIYEEIKTLSEISFRFKEKEIPAGYVSLLAHCLQRYPFEDVLTGPYLYQEWKPDLINEAMHYLLPEFVRVTVIGKKFEQVADETEPWYGAKYKIEQIPSSTIKKWENCGLCEELKLPKPNSFIASNFEILPLDEKVSSPHPSVIYTSPTSRVWFKQDDQFLLPKANLIFEFITPLADLDPVNIGLTHLFVNLLEDSLNEYEYDAKLAELSCNIRTTDYGMILSISGFNDKQSILLDKVLEKMTNFEIDPQRFEFIKDKFVRSLKNFEAVQPFTQALYYLSLLVSERGFMINDLLRSVDFLTVVRLKEFIPQLLSKLHVECLIHGNIDKEGASKIIDIFEKRLNAKNTLLPILPSQMLKKRNIQLEDGTHFMLEESNYFFTSSCTESYFQCDVLSTENNVLIELLNQILKNPCFDTLRTKEQLGYIVSSSVHRSTSVQGLLLLIQSDRHPLLVDQRIEAFLIQFREMLASMSQEEFEKHRDSLAAVKSIEPTQLPILTREFWKEITSQQYHFDRKKAEVTYLRTITKEQLLNFFDSYIRHKAPHRRKLSVYVLGKKEGGAGNEAAPDPESLSSCREGLPPPPPYTPPLKIDDIIKFKSSHRLYPLVQPHMNLNATLGKSKL